MRESTRPPARASSRGRSRCASPTAGSMGVARGQSARACVVPTMRAWPACRGHRGCPRALALGIPACAIFTQRAHRRRRRHAGLGTVSMVTLGRGLGCLPWHLAARRSPASRPGRGVKPRIPEIVETRCSSPTRASPRVALDSGARPARLSPHHPRHGIARSAGCRQSLPRPRGRVSAALSDAARQGRRGYSRRPC